MLTRAVRTADSRLKFRLVTMLVAGFLSLASSLTAHADETVTVTATDTTTPAAETQTATVAQTATQTETATETTTAALASIELDTTQFNIIQAALAVLVFFTAAAFIAQLRTGGAHD